MAPELAITPELAPPNLQPRVTVHFQNTNVLSGQGQVPLNTEQMVDGASTELVETVLARNSFDISPSVSYAEALRSTNPKNNPSHPFDDGAGSSTGRK